MDRVLNKDTYFSLTVRQRGRILWGRPFCMIIITKANRKQVKETVLTWSQNRLPPCNMRIRVIVCFIYCYVAPRTAPSTWWEFNKSMMIQWLNDRKLGQGECWKQIIRTTNNNSKAFQFQLVSASLFELHLGWFLFLPSPTLHCLQDVSSPTRDWTRHPCSGSAES